MIKLTKINGSPVVVNADLLEMVEATPDTIVTLSTGKKILVRDSIDEVIRKVVAYKQEVGGKITVVQGQKEPA
jgi:flagellar protein FlbD